ncbi:PaaI family thioesterase [Promethearchaeum syntrophicum]|uniref:PaaI family thioesterase n=1 Tax=Promethearchaeum syntrophicum TaxID=2594042 RepID=A0A5B9D5L2_9ARCH|nr:PaaI family thioesterase [Candidatus Prometheoarchaeum syntrophicum]QEE14221.1 hypothetical protein DSAG12_00032 [Candidatus Prometheoarchaeum syntrophicum]
MHEIDYSDLIKQGFKEILVHIPPGYGHYCFACSKSNPIGLKLRFFANIETEELVSRYIVPKEFCGFPKYSHGGILTTLVDELMAHVTFFIFGRYGITKSINVKFLRPVLIDEPIFIHSKISKSLEGKAGKEIYANAKIYSGKDSSGKLCVKSDGILVILPDDRFKNLYE